MAQPQAHTILLELQPQDVIILVDLVDKAANRNSDIRIKAAYVAILERIQESVLQQNSDTHVEPSPTS